MEFPTILNMQKVSDQSKVSYSKLYFRKTRKNGDVYTKVALEMTDRTRLVNTIVDKLKPFFRDMGFELMLKPRKD